MEVPLEYQSACYTCRMSFDAMEAAWCSCVTKQRSLVCPYCLNFLQRAAFFHAVVLGGGAAGALDALGG